MNTKKEIKAMLTESDLEEIKKITATHFTVEFLDDHIREVKNAIAAAIEYGRSTATAQTTTRPVMNTAESGKKFPITEAHAAAMELHAALVNAFEYYEEKDANHPREVALNVILADLMEQALYLECAIAKLVRAEK